MYVLRCIIILVTHIPVQKMNTVCKWTVWVKLFLFKSDIFIGKKLSYVCIKLQLLECSALKTSPQRTGVGTLFRTAHYLFHAFKKDTIPTWKRDKGNPLDPGLKTYFNLEKISEKKSFSCLATTSLELRKKAFFMPRGRIVASMEGYRKWCTKIRKIRKVTDVFEALRFPFLWRDNSHRSDLRPSLHWLWILDFVFVQMLCIPGF